MKIRALSRSWQFQRFLKEEPFAEHILYSRLILLLESEQVRVGSRVEPDMTGLFLGVPMILTHAIRGYEGMGQVPWFTELGNRKLWDKTLQTPTFSGHFPFKNQSIDPSRFFEFGDHSSQKLCPSTISWTCPTNLLISCSRRRVGKLNSCGASAVAPQKDAGAVAWRGRFGWLGGWRSNCLWLWVKTC